VVSRWLLAVIEYARAAVNLQVVIGCLIAIVTILVARPQRWRGRQEDCRCYDDDD